QSVISGGKCEISGSFSQKEATNLAALIRGGSLPVELKEVTSSAQTAKIGLDALEMSIYAGIIGAAIIFLIMLVGYRIMGVAADIALTLYILIMLAVMALMGSVLTLPGIAGIILSVGMAVYAKVVIFTIIKQEINKGRSIRVATQTGYKRAMSTVIDSQVTTLIAAIILYQIGTSSVKGFAWTLMIGIFASIFTAVLITQLYLSIISESKRFAKNKYFGLHEDGSVMFKLKKEFKFVKHRKIFYIISVAIIAVGILAGGIRGFNYGIDFTGGTMLHLDMGKKVSAEEIKTVAERHDINTAQMEIVYAGDNQEEVIIKTNESLDGDARTVLTDDLQKEFGIGEDDVLSSEHFGPSVGKELKANALKALLLSAIGMLIYIRIRFREWKFGSAALIGTLHDVLVVVAFYAVFNVTVNNPFIAAILTVVGYSINDTIVIFDRIRENLRFMHKNTNEEIIDISINQTLSRSIMTSATTLIVMVPLYIMASDSIREFVLPLMIGVLAGCLSSIFVCSPLYYEFSKGKDRSKYEKQIAKMKKEKKAGKETAAAELPAGSEHKEPPKGHKKKSREARRKDEK
ncbi:MAG: protein translocase subunit SecF, partial [Anaerovoracaceae bacterium]